MRKRTGISARMAGPHGEERALRRQPRLQHALLLLLLLLLTTLALAAGSAAPVPACQETHFTDAGTQVDLAASANVFFLHTSNETAQTLVQRCALASAVARNPTRKVWLFSNTLSCLGAGGGGVGVPEGVRVVRYAPADVYAPLPSMVAWYASGVWDVAFRGVHLSDSLRLALLLRYGGVYLDADVLSLRPLDGLVNAVGAEDPWMINNAVMAFAAGHPFVAQAAEEFVAGFSATWWGWNGPRLATRVWRANAGGRRADDVLLAPVEEFYPLSWREWERLLEPFPSGAAHLAALLPRTRLVHAWHNQVKHRIEELSGAGGGSIRSTMLGRIMAASCPAVLRDEAGDGGEESGEPAEGDAVLSVDTAGLTGGGLASWPAAASLDAGAVAHCDAPGAGAVLWEGMDEMVPVAAVAGGTALVLGAALGGAQALHGASPDTGAVLVGSGCLPSRCGLQCGSCGVRGPVGVSLPDGAGHNWTLAVWINTLTPDVTLREVARDTPRVDPASLPDAQLMPPGDVPVGQELLASLGSASARESPPSWLVPDAARGDVLVVAVEGGHVAVGGLDGEWMRSHSGVADGRWHHVVISWAVGAGGMAHVQLAVDALLHAERFLPAGRGMAAVAFGSLSLGAPADGRPPSLHLDALGVHDRALTHTDVCRLRNAQLRLLSRGPTCAPAVPWADPTTAAEGGQAAPPKAAITALAPVRAPRPPARIAVLVLSDARPGSAAARMAVRQSWVQLARDRNMRVTHTFCIERHAHAASVTVALEASRFGDVLFVGGNGTAGAPGAGHDVDGYRVLSRKVMACLRGLQSRPGRSAYDFVVKTDHDVFLRVDTLADELERVVAAHAASAAPASPLLYWRGFVYRGVPPGRELRDKNADTRVALMSFPPYTAGVAYVLSAALVAQLSALAQPMYTLNEDQSLGLWVRQAAAASGTPPVEPQHDVRFQQWAVCDEAQLAVHPSDPAQLRALARRVRAGAPMCGGHGYGTCCLCCDCAGMRDAWFVCDAHGAWVPEFTPLQQLVGVDDFAVSRSGLGGGSGSGGDGAPIALARKVVRRARALSLAGVAGATLPGGPSEWPDCPWEVGVWRPLGAASTSAADTSGTEASSNSRGEAQGLRLACRSLTPGALRLGVGETGVQPDVDSSNELFCGASVVVTPPASQRDCGLKRTAHISTAGSGVAAGVDAGASLRSFGGLRDAPRCSLLFADSPPRRAFPGQLEWLLLSAVVDTSGACVFANASDPVAAAALADDPAAVGEYRRYPRYGGVRAFCGVFVDVMHADGAVTALRSPFARDAGAYLHYEALRVLHSSPVVDVRLTVVLPSLSVPPGATSSLRVSHLTLAAVPLPPQPHSPSGGGHAPRWGGHAAHADAARQLLATDPRLPLRMFGMRRQLPAEPFLRPCAVPGGPQLALALSSLWAASTTPLVFLGLVLLMMLLLLPQRRPAAAGSSGGQASTAAHSGGSFAGLVHASSTALSIKQSLLPRSASSASLSGAPSSSGSLTPRFALSAGTGAAGGMLSAQAQASSPRVVSMSGPGAWWSAAFALTSTRRAASKDV